MFDCVLASDGIRGSRPRRAVSLPVSIAAHAVAAAAIVGATMWATSEPPDPEVPVIFYLPAAVPPAPAGPSNSVAAPAPAAVPRLAAPRPIPVAAAPEALLGTEPPEADWTDSADGRTGQPGPPGPPGGSLVGVPGGTGEPGGGLLDGSGPPPRPGGLIRHPDLLTRVEPTYPEAARRARLEGLVVLEAIISASGEIEEIQVVKSAGALLDSAAVHAVRRWKYRPATLNGRAIRVLLNVTVAFHLH